MILQLDEEAGKKILMEMIANIADKENLGIAAETFLILEKRYKSEIEDTGIKLPGEPLSMYDEWYAAVLRIIDSQDAIRMIEARASQEESDK